MGMYEAALTGRMTTQFSPARLMNDESKMTANALCARARTLRADKETRRREDSWPFKTTTQSVQKARFTPPKHRLLFDKNLQKPTKIDKNLQKLTRNDK
jgi:hypothetical protein